MSTEEQDLTARRDALTALGVEPEGVYFDHGFTGRNKNRAGLREALAACRAGDTFVATKLDRLARSVRDAHETSGDLASREGMKVAKANGRLRGKQPKLTVKQEAHLLELHDAGEYTMTEMAELFSISRSTIYRAVERGQRRAAEPLRS
ncbi:recombinase family protein [Arthrobacter alpinus]|uniref:recombinase family protein n=1 Tax=Arthrobacter alpinus TaxID=656366 RepID=UPI0028F72E94|nr:recombinase family protein [Arthrobacter alpinus]